MYLVGGTTLIGTEHNNIWGGVGELIGVKSRVVLEELHVSTTALETVCITVSRSMDAVSVESNIL
jgi:hypothetical protein